MAVPAEDVVIVGGGPAGAATAILLRRQGYGVTLLEKAHLPRPKPCGESLSPEATPLLAKLGVLETLKKGRHGDLAGFMIFPYEDAPFHGSYAARCAGNPVRATGMTIPRMQLDAVLLDAARSSGVTVREGWAVRDVGLWDGHGRQVSGRTSEGDPFALRTPLLVGADGVHSTVAQRLGLSRPSRRLRQLAIVTHMQGVAGMGAYGEMHVSEHGYCGVAPLGGDLANVAIVGPAAKVAEELRSSNDVTRFFRAHLDLYPQLGPRLRNAAIVAGPWTTSGLARRVRRRVDDGLMLVGDAGGYYDPFTGEGMYRGLRSAELAAEVAGTALGQGDTQAPALQRYAAGYRKQFAPKRLVEIIVHEVTIRRPLFEHVSVRLRQRQHLADALIGVTGDFLSPYEVLSPWYLTRLVV